MATNLSERRSTRATGSSAPGCYLYRGNSLGVSIAVVLAGMLLSVLLIGWRSPFWARAASDLVSAYEGLLYNDRLPQEFLAYPALLSGQLLGLWYRLLHLLGLLPVDRVSQLPNAPSLAQFETIWQALVVGARGYTLAIGLLYVAVFSLLVDRLTRVWQIAALAAVALAFSSGVALEYRIIRSELPSSALIFTGLLATLVAAREHEPNRQLGWLACAALCATLGYVEKVQALLPALAIPVIALAFPPAARSSIGSRAASTADDWRKAAVVAALAIVVLIPAFRMMQWGITAMPTAAYLPYPRLGGGLSGVYQWLIGLGIIAAMVFYGWVWRVPPAHTAAAVAAVLFGIALGLCAICLRYNPQVVAAIANPLEHLQAHAGGDGAGLPSGSTTGIIGKLIGSAVSALAIHTLVFYPSHRPTLIVEWLTIAAAVVLWRRGDRQRCLQIGLLLAAGMALDGLFSLRQYKVFYLPFTDPFIIIAGAIAAVPFLDLLLTRRVQLITMGLIAFYILWGHVQSARVAYGATDKEGKICVVVAQFTTRVSWPYCAPR